MLNELNQADLQMEFSKSSEHKALSNIASSFPTLLAVDISIEYILILYMAMEFLRLVFISTKTFVLSMFSCNMLAVIQDFMPMKQCWMLLMIKCFDSALLGLKAGTARCHRHKNVNLADISVL